VLTGSLARNEATLVEERGSRRLLGDAEFLLIFHPWAPLPPKVAMNFLRQNIETSISRLGITGEMCLSAAHPKYLRSLRPDIFAYELQNCGQVVGGDLEVLTLIPSFSPSDIPLEDGWRLLSNRMIEQLEVLESLEQGPKLLSGPLLYRTLKLYLDMATSFLLFVGEYAPSYSERERRLKNLAETTGENRNLPFDLGGFCDRVSECTRWKLSGTKIKNSSGGKTVSEFDSSWWEKAVEYAQLLWRWELASLVGTVEQAGNQELLEKWMKSQPATRRLRGWVHVARDQGWDGIRMNWRRWARLAWRASPRDWVYAGASHLFFQLPCTSEPAFEAMHFHQKCETVLSHLPVSNHIELDPRGSRSTNWRRVASVVAWNYGKFLKETRS